MQVSRTSCACWDRLLATPSPPPACLSTSHHPSPLLLKPEIHAGLALGGLVTCLTLFLVFLVYIINLAFNLVIYPNGFLKLIKINHLRCKYFFPEWDFERESKNRGIQFCRRYPSNTKCLQIRMNPF